MQVMPNRPATTPDPAANAAMQKALAALVVDHPFFATLAMRMLRYDPVLNCNTFTQDSRIETAATNGKVLYYNPSWIMSLSHAQRVGLLVHEVMHVAAGHPFRRGNRDHGRFNMAGDYAINGIIAECKITLPPDGLLDSKFKTKDGIWMSAEQIYNLLEEPPEDQPQPEGEGDDEDKGQPGDDEGKGKGDAEGDNDGDGEGEGEGEGEGDGEGSGKGGSGKGGPGKDPGKCGGFFDPTDDDDNVLSDAEKAQLDAEWRVEVVKAANIAKAKGNLPGGLARLVDDIAHPCLDWREVLRSFIQMTAKTNYDWNYPNRRHIANGLYLPSLRGEELKPIIVAVDTSGSVGGKELAAFGAEINDILAAYPCTVHVVYCDARVNGVEEFSSDERPIVLKHLGGGGTDFRPVFEWAEAQDFEPACIVYLTDMMGDFPEHCDVPTLWVSTTNPNHLPSCYTPPFGEVAHLEV